MLSDEIDTALTLIEDVTFEPLDLEEVKKILRYSATREDTALDGWMAAARTYFEEETGRDTSNRTREYWLDEFPGQRQIEIPRPPLQSVLSIKYDDADGVEQTFDAANYRVINPHDAYCVPGRIALVYGASWPATICQAKAVRIQFISGYGNARGDVPELAKAAMLYLVGHFHKFRAETQENTPGTSLVQVPIGFASIVRAFKYTARPTLPPTRCRTWA